MAKKVLTVKDSELVAKNYVLNLEKIFQFVFDESISEDHTSKIKICITGKLESGLTKSEFYQKYSDKVIESNVNDCDFLICNKAGSSKARKAESLGKSIISENDFINKYYL